MSSDVRFTDFKSDKQPTWCPGCGDFGTMNGIMKALANSGNDPDNTFLVAGIGCSGKIGTYMHSYAIHGVHGRSLPVAAGAKLANPNLTVVAAGGDGDGYSIGAGHFIHAVRRNVDMAYVVMDNRIYGLTKGQASPTSREDFETSTTPEGPQQPPVNPLALSLAAGGTFIAQSFATDHKRHAEIVQEAIEHDGFGFVNVFSPCVTFNDVDTYDYFRDNLVDLKETDHDPTDYDAAKDKILDSSKEYEGIIYKDESSVSYEQNFGVTENMSDIPSGAPDDAMDLVREFY
ncbi:2-oxoacid:ferredoxin oxidoreductase subunit beta [Haloferax mediterranei ATCC 33500]|uniref:2-oxoacid ferredoxin oxidoreductase n=1 Tax=Haloferax mediterranei (strain ATCC 33500 / DSM 1411 / JCM 8866 / NBRC 14739 / NCIMB 2177 / R-4) TaxID=523841 RepID=I3R2X2_HALMT|nr:2-oxoacid:ferredoxin oxidoreductase subunit beta [Haloferax mediterranei]AFK18582.1 2-oxoglutarate ferredoxin oxidoreductase, subunit beta [Haloferax mediterranei ATCC 33500]AHZ22044.1 2-oxoacid ferredoxin oxidoreductase [Haloferax mediterranei ATCC 33500]EMA02143.1 2-oxoglutarate ferredoxin oxidoreductase subunit beta [Haloferax mediterranei ATCC 33500]MDX5988670.1 2-oxoacid:ferredoxin oxidoreductase subunit beta [Haloferax mediterranei ATCC 33500]QCQ75082.1 2-oxoacid:ferredoxin oxidoreduc